MPTPRILLALLFFNLAMVGMGQSKRDTLYSNFTLVKDSLKSGITSNSLKKKHIPQVATRRSALIPGWGQAYNHEYWKIPIVYGALAIPAYTFFYNNSFYKKTKYAYQVRVNNDSANFANIDPQLKSLDLYALQSYRNSFRRDRDYSILWFVILWGVNVTDATVFGHLKDFDVSDDLSMHIKPSLNLQNKIPGLDMVINYKTPKHRTSHLLE